MKDICNPAFPPSPSHRTPSPARGPPARAEPESSFETGSPSAWGQAPGCRDRGRRAGAGRGRRGGAGELLPRHSSSAGTRPARRGSILLPAAGGGAARAPGPDDGRTGGAGTRGAAARRLEGGGQPGGVTRRPRPSDSRCVRRVSSTAGRCDLYSSGEGPRPRDIVAG